MSKDKARLREEIEKVTRALKRNYCFLVMKNSLASKLKIEAVKREVSYSKDDAE